MKYEFWVKFRLWIDHQNDVRVLVYVILGTVALSTLALIIANPYITIALNCLPILLFYILWMRRGRYQPTVGLILLWATTLIAVNLSATLIFPGPVSPLESTPGNISRALYEAEDYNNEMFVWLRTNAGPEAVPIDYSLNLARDAGIHTGAGILTGGIGSLPLIAVRVSKNAYFFGNLFSVSKNNLIILFMGLPFWRIVGIIGFANLSVAVGIPLSAIVFKRKKWGSEFSTHLFLALVLLFLDALIHLSVSPFWRVLLSQAIVNGVY